MSTPAVSISHLTVAYNNKPVLWDITAEIPQGVMLGVVGPNGAGKTTLIKSLVNLVKPMAGTIKIFGAPFAHIRDQIAYIPQRATIDWDFPVTVFDVVMMGRFGALGWFGRPRAQDHISVYETLERVGLEQYKDTPISHLSGGQQQRVFLARALVQHANLYILDEPFVGIDAATEKTVVAILQELRAQGKTLLIVHHDLHTITHYFDWLLLLNVSCISIGPTAQTYTPSMLQHTYGNQIREIF
jgi:manganese/zinc/iron transport system ATP- binding protein